MAGRRPNATRGSSEPARRAATSSARDEPPDRNAPPGIVIWDLENCAVPARCNEQLPALVKALRSSFRASRVVTAAEIPATNKAKTDQLRALSYSDVEVLTFLRPDTVNSSEKKHSSADFMLKRALQRFLSTPCQGSRVTLITSDADFISEIYHVQDFGLQVHLLCDVEHCSNVLKEAADTFQDWRAFLYLHCDVPPSGEMDAPAPRPRPTAPNTQPTKSPAAPPNLTISQLPPRLTPPPPVPASSMAAVFAATQNAVVLSSYAPYVAQSAIEAHALQFAQQAGQILRLHTKPSSEGGFHCVVNFVDAAAAEAAVTRLRPPPVGGKVPTVQCWTGKLQAYLSRPSTAGAAPAAAAKASDPVPAAARPARVPPVAPSALLEPIPLQALTKDIQPPPELAATIAILFYPTSTAEAAAAKHAREFATPFGKISSLLVKRHASKGLYALVTFCELEATAAAVAAELTPPVNAHLPRVVQWTSQLKAEFAGAAQAKAPAAAASTSSRPAPSSASRPVQPSSQHPRDAFAGRGASAVPMHNSRHGPVADSSRRPASAGAVPASAAPSHIMRRPAADRRAHGNPMSEALGRPASASMAISGSRPAASDLHAAHAKRTASSRPTSAPTAPSPLKQPHPTTPSAHVATMSLESTSPDAAPVLDGSASVAVIAPVGHKLDDPVIDQVESAIESASEPEDGDSLAQGGLDPPGIHSELLYQPGDDADQNGFVTSVPDLGEDSDNRRVAVSSYPASFPATQVQMHAAAAASLHGKLKVVSVHMGSGDPAPPLACISFEAPEAAEQMTGQKLPSVRGGLPSVCEWPAHQSLPLATPTVPGYTYIMITGYPSDVDANGRTSHAAGSFEGISGLVFIAPTKCQGRAEADPAVLISLTTSAASQFAKKHIYGLEMMLSAGPVTLKWEQLSLPAARQALSFKDTMESEVSTSTSGALERPGSAPAGLQKRPLSAASRTSSHGDPHSPTSHASSALEATVPPDDLPSPTPGGIHVWQLSKFPLACPLGHVQLYVAAAAAAAGQALSISVGLAKVLPHRPVAWVEMDSSVAFHPKHSRRKSPMIDGTQPVYLPSRAAISALPAPGQAPGQTVILIQGFTTPADLASVQRRADGCCLGLEGIHFCIATYQRESSPPQLIAAVSLTTPAAFRFRSRHPNRTIRPTSAGQTLLTWKEVSLPDAGKLLGAPCTWLT